MILAIFLLIIGFVVLILGANWLVDGATSIGIRAKLSPLIIGLTIVALGTSLPELIINVFSCFKGVSGLAIGNIVGSNIMNILLILGIAALIYPIDVSNISIRRDIPAGFIATTLLALMANVFFTGKSHFIVWWEGLILLAGAAIYLFLTMVKTEKPDNDVEAIQIPLPWWKTILFLVFGIIGLYLGGELVSNNAQIIAKAWGMSDALIGLTVVAIATSLPELITSIVAAKKKNARNTPLPGRPVAPDTKSVSQQSPVPAPVREPLARETHLTPTISVTAPDDSVYQGSMNAVTGEGYDPCHDEDLAGLNRAEAMPPAHPAGDAASLPFGWTGSDMVRGIVVSEILNRKRGYRR